MTALVTEEDKPIIAGMIRKLKRYRKREHAHGKKHYSELDDSIQNLMDYGELKGWWKSEQ